MENQNKIEFIETLRKRTKEFVVRSTKLYRALPKTGEAKIFGNQFLRAASSFAANYRAACRARSQREFFAKMSLVVEEIDETLFWLEIITETGIFSLQKTKPLMDEANELLAIMSSARSHIYKSKSN